MRVPFDQIFETNSNGSVTAKAPVRIGKSTLTPGVPFTEGVSFDGIDIVKNRGHDLEIEQEAEGFIITSVYE